MYDLIIVGGGAGGLFAAAQAVRCGLKTAVLERNPRVGKKLLSTGNGRCNLSDTDTDIGKYNSRFPEKILNKYPSSRIVEEFKTLGLLTTEEGGRIYPYSMLAGSVLNVLRDASRKACIYTDCRAESIVLADDRFIVKSALGDTASKNIILASGSGAGGGTASYGLFGNFGHTITAPVPSLCPMPCDSSRIKGLQGVRHRVRAAVSANGHRHEECGEILFKQAALSGIVSFNMSAILARSRAASGVVTLDFFPDYSASELIKIGEDTLKNALHKNLYALIKENGGDFAASLKAYRINVTPCRDFSLAQAASGGLNVSEFDSVTLESKIKSGLYAIGEALDVDGLCGGYNLHWAWASALAAVEAIADSRF